MEIIIAYTVGTMVGLWIGANWGLQKGVVTGVELTIHKFEKLKLLVEGWDSDEKVLEKLANLQVQDEKS